MQLVREGSPSLDGDQARSEPDKRSMDEADEQQQGRQGSRSRSASKGPRSGSRSRSQSLARSKFSGSDNDDERHDDED